MQNNAECDEKDGFVLVTEHFEELFQAVQPSAIPLKCPAKAVLPFSRSEKRKHSPLSIKSGDPAPISVVIRAQRRPIILLRTTMRSNVNKHDPMTSFISISRKFSLWPCAIGLILIFSLCAASASAGPEPPALILDPSGGKIDLGGGSQILADKTAGLELEQVSGPDFTGRFVDHSGLHFEFEEPGTAYWIRFKLAPAEGGEPSAWVLEAGKHFSRFIGWIDLFAPEKGTEDGYRRFSAGANRPPNPEGYRHRNLYLKIPNDFDRNRFWYLRIRSEFAISEPMTLWPVERLWAAGTPSLLIPVFAYGVMMAMAAYNFFILLTLGTRVYLYYTLYICFTLLWQFFAQGYVHFFFDFGPGVFVRLDYLLGPCAAVFTLLMIRAFLDTGSNMPKIDKCLLVVIAGFMFSSILVLMNLYELSDPFGNVLGLVMTGFLVSATVIRISQGFRPARLLLPAWFFITIGICAYLLQNLRILPINVWTTNAHLFGASLESIFLSFALAARIKALERERTQLVESERRYKNLSLTDGLTGLYSRRYFDEKLKTEVALAGRINRPLALVVMDIDDFKSVNDTHGHPVGDKVLLALGDIIRASIRKEDIACRYGGEEFGLILPATDRADAEGVAERIRNRFAEQRFKTDGVRTFTCTISLGLALWKSDYRGPGELLQRADAALYRAKSAGKNRVVKV